MQTKERWGWGVFGGSVAIVAGAMRLLDALPPGSNSAFYLQELPAAGLVLSLIAFAIGHFSYPRVHNLRVYLLGYVAGLIGIGYFGLLHAPFNLGSVRPGAGYAGALFMAVFINYLVVVSVPSFVKYRVARAITLSVIGTELVLILVARFSPEATVWALPLKNPGMARPAFWIGPLWAAVIVGVSIVRMRRDFFLGGVIAGCACIYSAAWIWGAGSANADLLQRILFTAAPLYLGCGMLIHWFSRMDHRIAYDPLLQIYNRDYCSKIITEQANLNVLPPFTVAMVDIDHFKKVNDTYGHQAGDAVLFAVAQAVGKGAVPQGIVCRYGGEELAVFFPQMNSKNVAVVMEKIRADIEKIKTPSEKKNISVTISCGIAHRENLSQSVMEVIHAADKALYKAKHGGRNQVRVGR